MYKLKPIPCTHYSEVAQTNPMRWACLFLEDNVFVPQSGWWKCKDFLNDVVIYHELGKEFPMYGFQNKVKLNDEGGFVALKDVPVHFHDNLGVLNTWLVEKGFEPILIVSDFEKAFDVATILLIPRTYWKNTFLISIITSLIRSCAFAKATTVKQLVKKEATFNSYWEKVDALFVPQNLDKMNQLVFINYQYSKKTLPGSEYTYHNAGMQTWSNSWKNFQ